MPLLRATASAVAVCVLLSCSSGQPDDPASVHGRVSGGSSSTSSAAPEPTDSQPADGGRREAPERLWPVPTRDADALAIQLDRMAATLRDPRAASDVVRRAGEFQQLAARQLATRSDRFRRRVLAQVRPATRRLVRADVRASRLLHVLTDPQKSLPRWRIVEPPPPAELRGYYRRAERRTGVPWNYLAAINLVETRMGRIRGVSTAGAQGPMQFLPSTWELYGAGGDINDPRDAILAAARLLRANGAPGDMAEALWHYNPSDDYVGAVTEYARTMRRWPSAYRGYWHWRVLYRHQDGTYVLPVGYPKTPAVMLPPGT